MQLPIGQEIAALNRLSLDELRDQYAQLFGDETKTNNRVWLIKRLAWRLQANAEGGLSERAKQRALELANDADLRLLPPRPTPQKASITEAPLPAQPTVMDQRLPSTGTILTRAYKGELCQVTVLADGFEWDGQRYKSLSAVAKAITGSHCSGYLFFGLAKTQGASS